MKTKDAIDYFGGPTNLAAKLRRQDGRLGIYRQAIYGWGETPPIGRQYEIEVATGGALLADRQTRDGSAASGDAA